jgi:hypothetical protein
VVYFEMLEGPKNKKFFRMFSTWTQIEADTVRILSEKLPLHVISVSVTSNVTRSILNYFVK